MKTALDRYTEEEIVDLRKSIQSAILTRDMYNKVRYARWSQTYKKSKLPFHVLTYKDTYENEDTVLSLFSSANCFVHGMEMPMKEIPKYLNSPSKVLVEAIKWRLKVGR